MLSDTLEVQFGFVLKARSPEDVFDRVRHLVHLLRYWTHYAFCKTGGLLYDSDRRAERTSVGSLQ